MESKRNSGPPPHLNRLGQLCFKGQELATYLFQVPDDETQWREIKAVVDAILEETSGSPRRELPRLAAELRNTANGPHDLAAAGQLQSGFDRMVKLWEASRSGMF